MRKRVTLVTSNTKSERLTRCAISSSSPTGSLVALSITSIKFPFGRKLKLSPWRWGGKSYGVCSLLNRTSLNSSSNLKSTLQSLQYHRSKSFHKASNVPPHDGWYHYSKIMFLRYGTVFSTYGTAVIA